MEKLSVKAARQESAIGQTVTVEGWVRTRRDSKAGFSFIELNDGSCLGNLQVLAPQELANYESEVKRLTAGCCVRCRGEVVASQGGGQATELKADELHVYGWAEPETYPLQKKRHSFEKLREWGHLRPRTNAMGAVMRVRNRLCRSIHEFFQEDGFLNVQTPIITTSDCEGAGEMFRVTTLDPANAPRTEAGGVDWARDFFGREAHLTVSGQLEGEAYACALGRIYTFGPTFRAENSNTSRHLAEFWMVEPEAAFFDLDDNMDLAERFLKRLVGDVLRDCDEDLALFNQHIDKTVIARLEKIAESAFVRMPYTDAVALLEQSGEKFEFPVSWGADLQAEHERYITEKHVGGPVVLYDYPRSIKPFYMRVNDDDKTVRAMDVLVPGVGEIIGGSQREERLDVLTARMQEQGIEPDDYQWYVDLRRYGTAPHSGFGLGLERMVQFTTGMANIRDVIPFPRTPGHAGF
ncbi:Asparagine--tRNA ligase [Pseudobythopirellula maris]|uniref:Asparagine--tRNA ligase n=1 Tax=Pseudobythopirellula maris TaxID=2527991 RepID=A0A5C5ZNH8_9BACT|nr:asparagine--tRNA ligase [Pseudobythopirellula maris]TWT88391.1 Asparagine--tRNA ligase [Pseudobythopirellula maris]